MADEFAWLIEFPGGSPAWWDGRGVDTGVLDANDAVRFARKEDAERVASWLIAKTRGYLITEHGWSDMAPTVADDPARAIAALLSRLSEADKDTLSWLIRAARAPKEAG